MPHPLPLHVPRNLGCAIILDWTDPTVKPFLDACSANEAALALQLAASCHDEGVLTHGLNKAVGEDHLELASELLRVGAKWDSSTAQIASKSFTRVRWLVESGFDVNTLLLEGHVLLHFVISENEEDSIRYLLELGADPTLSAPSNTGLHMSEVLPIPDGGDSLDRVVVNCSSEIFDLLLSYGADVTKAIPLHVAVSSRGKQSNQPWSSKVHMLEHLLDLGVDINGLDNAIMVTESGWMRRGTPLHYAIWESRNEEIVWLLEHGADPDENDCWGMTPRNLITKLSRSAKTTALLLNA